MHPVHSKSPISLQIDSHRSEPLGPFLAIVGGFFIGVEKDLLVSMKLPY
jgi:hypothetical protein